MIAIVSDIHGNLEALQAVMQDIGAMNASSVVCLGDLVGYGPDPIACVEIAMNWPVVLRGNFDDAVIRLDQYSSWPDHLTQMIQRLQRRIRIDSDANRIMAFLTQRPTMHTGDRELYVHGSPRDNLNEYVFPEHIYDAETMAAVFSSFDHLCFCGHTHLPGVFTQSSSGQWIHTPATDSNDVFHVRRQQTLCNVGSVGQPRDNDPRACYVLFDGEIAVFRRVDYDIETTIKKIRSGDDDDMHGNRLAYGH